MGPIERPEQERDRELAALLRKANEQLVCNALVAQEAVQREQGLREELEARNEELKTVIESMADAVFVCDASGTITLANNIALGLIGKRRGEPVGSFIDVASALRLRFPDGRLVHAEDLAMSRALRLGEVETGQEVMVTHPRTEQRRSLLISAAPLHDRQGRVVGVVGVATDVTQMRELQEQLKELILLMGHDLRSPLAHMLGMAQLTQRTMEKKGLKRESEGMAALIQSARRMDRMIQDLVESSRLEAGQVALRKEPVDVIRLISDLAERLGSDDDRKRIHANIPDWVPPVLADAALIERALTNILANALKYSPVDQPVEVRVGRRDGEAVVAVIDQGVGIPAEELPHIFERHFRAKTAGRREGLGLGLYITRLLVEAHGGQVWAESAVGKGSTFYVALPLA